MANQVDFILRITGDSKGIHKATNILLGKDEKFLVGVSAYISDVSMFDYKTSDVQEVLMDGFVKWNAEKCFLQTSSMCYYNRRKNMENTNITTLENISRLHNVQFEVFSEDIANQFQEHIVVSDGIVQRLDYRRYTLGLEEDEKGEYPKIGGHRFWKDPESWDEWTF